MVGRVSAFGNLLWSSVCLSPPLAAWAGPILDSCKDSFVVSADLQQGGAGHKVPVPPGLLARGLLCASGRRYCRICLLVFKRNGRALWRRHTHRWAQCGVLSAEIQRSL